MNFIQNLRSQVWLLVIASVVLLSSFGIGLTNPILSLYGRMFTQSTMLAGLFIMLFAFGRVVATIPASHAAQRWGYLAVMVVGLLIKALGAVGVASATRFERLMLPRFFQGAGDALVMSSALLAITIGSTPGQRGKNTSLFQTAAFLGLALSPTLGGEIADSYGVRAPIWIQSGISVILAVSIWAVSSRILVPNQLEDQDQTRLEASLTRELNSRRKNLDFLLVALSAFLIFMARAGARDTLLPIYAREKFGMESVEIGVLFNIFAIVNLLSIPVSGYLVDRIGRKMIIGYGLLLLAGGVLTIGFSSSYTILLIGVISMACGKGLSEPATLVYLADIANPRRISGSFGLFLTIRDLGLVMGPIVLGWIADLGGLQMPYTFNGIACAACAIIFLLFAREGYKVRPVSPG
jgi:MFS family permease